MLANLNANFCYKVSGSPIKSKYIMHRNSKISENETPYIVFLSTQGLNRIVEALVKCGNPVAYLTGPEIQFSLVSNLQTGYTKRLEKERIYISHD